MIRDLWATRVEGVDRSKGECVHPHPKQAGQKIPSCLNVRKKVVIASLYTLWSVMTPTCTSVLSELLNVLYDPAGLSLSNMYSMTWRGCLSHKCTE